jgi:hypothetical protein
MIIPFAAGRDWKDHTAQGLGSVVLARLFEDIYGAVSATVRPAVRRCEDASPRALLIPSIVKQIRARAADSIFNHAAKAIELEDIDARLSELERASEASREMKKS